MKVAYQAAAAATSSAQKLIVANPRKLMFVVTPATYRAGTTTTRGTGYPPTGRGCACAAGRR
jgi:hypothetical protein